MISLPSEKSSAGSGRESLSESSLRRSWPGRMETQQKTRRFSSKMRNTNIDFDRLTSFKYAIINAIGEDGFLFNHISAIPTGGYTDRRYMLVSGRLSDQKGKLKLDPESITEWDEKILPFGELCAKAAPQGQRYLQTIRQIEA